MDLMSFGATNEGDYCLSIPFKKLKIYMYLSITVELIKDVQVEKVFRECGEI
jgi:hypothetical protein